MERFEHLRTIYVSFQGDESMIRGKIKEDEGNRYYFIPGLENTNVIFALNEIFLEDNPKQAKLFLYRAASVAEYMSRKYDRRIIDSGINQISYALLSDNVDLIQRYSVLRNTVNHELNIGYQLPNAVQNILLDNWDKLEENIRNLERFVKVARFKWWDVTIEVFKGFMARDQSLIEQGLRKMLITHNKRNKDPLIARFLSVDTAGLCKLAWIKGYEIDLENGLVPQALMPINPLDSYQDYDLLHD